MTSPPSPAAGRPSPATVRRSVRLAVVATSLLATLGGFGLSLGVMTACTNDYSCTVTGCAPCATAHGWVLAGWAGQAVLLAGTGVLAVLAARRVRPRAVRTAARWIPVLGLGLLVVAGMLAHSSF